MVVADTAGSVAGANQATMAAWSKGAFALGAASTLMEAFGAKDSAEQQAKALDASMQQSSEIAKNRDRLEEVQVNRTLDMISSKAMKNRSTFQVAKGESMSGATYNALMRDMRNNELAARQAVKSQDAQNRIQQREELMARFTQIERQKEQIEDSVPTGLEVALNIGMQAASTYFTGGGTLFM